MGWKIYKDLCRRSRLDINASSHVWPDVVYEYFTTFCSLCILVSYTEQNCNFRDALFPCNVHHLCMYEYCVIQIKICAEYRYMLPRPRLDCQEPGLRPISRNPGVGVTKAPFVNFSVSQILDLPKVPVRLFASHSYLTGVTAAELRRHLSHMNMIFNR